MPRWSVDIIRKRAEHLGEVDAPDEQAAIKRAAEVFDIPPERQNRISVRRIGKGERARPANKSLAENNNNFPGQPHICRA
jgi:hypothetical protein